MSDLNLQSKIEDALQATVSALAISGLSVLTGQDDGTKTLPCVVCRCVDVAEDNPIGSGNHWATATVSVVSNASETPRSAHTGYVAQVFDGIRQTDTASTLSAATSGFHVLGITGGEMSADDTESNFQNTLSLNLYCCASDMS